MIERPDRLERLCYEGRGVVPRLLQAKDEVGCSLEENVHDCLDKE